MEIQFYNFPNIHSIPTQFPLNAFILRFSYAYPTAKQYHTGTTCWINTKTEAFFMRELRNTKIIAVDHGYGNMKTANTVTPTGIKAYETEPIFTGNILEYNGIYYRIGEGHKEFMQWFLQHYGIVRPPSIHLIC